MREDFTRATKNLLARRVTFRCSNPWCQQLTSGPKADPFGAVNIRVAAHITVASPDGPRYDPTVKSEESVAPDNGIWLCQTGGKLAYNDEVLYTVKGLKAWKAQAEALCRYRQISIVAGTVRS